MTTDLKSMTRKQLERLRTDVDKALRKLTGTEKKAARAAAEKAAKKHGFSLAEIVGATPAAKPGRKAAVGSKTKSVLKYANPADKTKTWTGKGRQPDWFKTAMASGTTPDDLAI